MHRLQGYHQMVKNTQGWAGGMTCTKFLSIQIRARRAQNKVRPMRSQTSQSVRYDVETTSMSQESAVLARMNSSCDWQEMRAHTIRARHSYTILMHTAA